MSSYRYVIYFLDTDYVPPRLTNALPWWTDPSSDPSYSLSTVVIDLVESRCFWQGVWMPVNAMDEAGPVVRVSKTTFEAIFHERDAAIARMHLAYELLGKSESWRSKDVKNLVALHDELAQLTTHYSTLRGMLEKVASLFEDDAQSLSDSKTLTAEQYLMLKTVVDSVRTQD